MQLSTEKKHWTEAELMSLPKVGEKYELVEGELVVTPATMRHEFITVSLIHALEDFVKRNRLGRVAGSNLGCWMKNGNVRCPDVSFISIDRVRNLGQEVDGFLKGSPDLAAEIVSPSNTVKTLKEKSVDYFESGAKVVWIVNPSDRTVLVLRADGSEMVLSDVDTLDGEEVIPGFSLPVSELFEDPE